MNPTPSPTVFMTTPKNGYNYLIHFIVDVINDYHDNSKVVKGRQQEKIYIVKVLEMMPCGALKFQIAF
jgi:hypothetical protein